MTVVLRIKINNIFLLPEPSLESATKHYIALPSENMRLYRLYRMLYDATYSKNHAMMLWHYGVLCSAM